MKYVMVKLKVIRSNFKVDHKLPKKCVYWHQFHLPPIPLKLHLRSLFQFIQLQHNNLIIFHKFYPKILNFLVYIFLKVISLLLKLYNFLIIQNLILPIITFMIFKANHLKLIYLFNQVVIYVPFIILFSSNYLFIIFQV